MRLSGRKKIFGDMLHISSAGAKCHICRQRFNYTLQTHDMSKSYTSYRLCHLLKVSSRAYFLSCCFFFFSSLSRTYFFFDDDDDDYLPSRFARDSQKWERSFRCIKQVFLRSSVERYPRAREQFATVNYLGQSFSF